MSRQIGVKRRPGVIKFVSRLSQTHLVSLATQIQASEPFGRTAIDVFDLEIWGHGSLYGEYVREVESQPWGRSVFALQTIADRRPICLSDDPELDVIAGGVGTKQPLAMKKGVFVGLLFFSIHVSPVARDVAGKKFAGRLTGFGQFAQGTGCGNTLAKRKIE